MKKIVLFGSTGSIGQEVLRVVKKHEDQFEILALVANTNLPLLREQWENFHSKYVGFAGLDSTSEDFKGSTLLFGKSCEDLATLTEADIIFVASQGISSLNYVLKGVESGKKIALANKETLCCCGRDLMTLSKKCGSEIIPVDSEHSAIWQCLQGSRREDLKRIILTASGGSFVDYSLKDMENITPKDALCHPTWKMGPKITVDSGTLFNKGLEMIEAQALFDLEVNQIDVIVHRQSVIHSMVEYCDNSVIAQLSRPTMEIPIQLALTGFSRRDTRVSPLDFKELKSLTFEEASEEKFPAISLSREVMKKGGYYPMAFSSGNEVFVSKFLNGEISFLDITRKTQLLLEKIKFNNDFNLKDIEYVNNEIKKFASTL